MIANRCRPSAGCPTERRASVARYLEGSALRILGQRNESRDRLEEGEGVGAQLAPASQGQCVAQLAALALEVGDWDTATRLIDRFGALVARYELRERPAYGIAFAISALVHAKSGEGSEARREAKHALFLVSMLSTVAPWLSVEELFVSRNTVKTQAISICRKLGVSSRDPAVAAARSLGLLEA